MKYVCVVALTRNLQAGALTAPYTIYPMTSPKIPDSLRRVVLASNNPGKLREFSALFAPLGIELVPQGDLGVPEAEEPHVTFVENALTKARHASRLTGLPALADDSGLCVAALDGAPGVYSARYAKMHGGEKSDQANKGCLLYTSQMVKSAASSSSVAMCRLMGMLPGSEVKGLA